jgi:hypothetical protein
VMFCSCQHAKLDISPQNRNIFSELHICAN